jgi:hypothetical protein
LRRDQKYSLSGNIPILWTNNNNEAYNNVIKQNQNWAVLKLPALINKLKRDWHCSKLVWGVSKVSPQQRTRVQMSPEAQNDI